VPEIGYGVPTTGSLVDALSAIPSDYRPYFRDGFSRLAKLKRDQWPTLIRSLEHTSPYPSNFELEPIAESLGLEGSGGRALLNAARLVLGVVTLRDDSPRDFAETACKTEMLDAADRDAIGEFTEQVARTRLEIRKSLARGELSQQIFPSLVLFDVKVDLRLEFAEGKVSAAVPVVIAHIDTDSTNSELWFQMSYTQLVALEKKLASSLEELQLALAVAKQLS
jgi:hypothetical protein